MKEKIAKISVLTNFLLALGKISAGFLSGSTSVLAEGIHSGMDILSAGISLFGIRASNKPIDKEHPYGHYKFEVLSGLAITLILFLTGIFIIYEAYKKFLNPAQIQINYLVLIIMGLSAVINEVMARTKLYYGKKENSISLLSDGVHSRIDVFTSAAVFIGVIISRHFSFIDPLLALLIGLYIIKESFCLGKEATDSLLDVSAGNDIENKIRNIVKAKRIELSELKTQKKGQRVTANLKLNLPGTLNVKQATDISDELRKNLLSYIPVLEYIAIQIESHDISENYFEPHSIFGKGFGWQGKGRMKDEIIEATGAGPEGYCVCPKGDYKIKHEKGIPCVTLKCPKHKINLIRE